MDLMDKRKRITRDDINVPAKATDVPGGYPVYAYKEPDGCFTCHIYAPIMPSPRPRVTTRGTYMPTEYRKHCEALRRSMGFAIGTYGMGGQVWDSSLPMHLDLAFWCPKLPGDLDNLAKTIMDAGQLHKGQEPGDGELWHNDKQIHKLSVEWLETEEREWWQTFIRVIPKQQACKVRT